jgi:hypothetical protein
MLTLDRVILERRQVMIVYGDRESNASSAVPLEAKQKANTPTTLKQQMRYILPTMRCATKPEIPGPL